MIRKLRAMQEKEEGFTLIELLVVVIIIGILAAIAIPSFLSQRESAYQADLTSAVRNYALEVEAEATKNNGNYPADLTGVADPSGNADVTYTYGVATDGSRFCLIGRHADLSTTVSMIGYDSGQNGMLAFREAGYTCGATTGVAAAS